MHDEHPLTGAEVEARGILTFECEGCRDRFPARCVEHDGRPKPARPRRPPATPQTPSKPKPPLSFDRNPPRGYWGRYDGLITDLKSALRAPAGGPDDG